MVAACVGLPGYLWLLRCGLRSGFLRLVADQTITPVPESVSPQVQAWLDKVRLHQSPTLDPCLMETVLILIASAAMLIAPTLLAPGRAVDDDD